jgi:phosphotransferase system HPr (HPr) family protein
MEMATTITQRFKITFPEGLHLRPSAMLAEIAGHFFSDITVCFNGSVADAKSPLEMIALEAVYGKQVTVIAQGRDAFHAMGVISELFSTGLGA